MREDKERQRQRKEDGETQMEGRGLGGTDRGKRMERHRGKGMERQIEERG